MSEAMSNREIEDVLSSIRRLVAQEARPQPERLVLTAAQRVAGPETPAPADAADPTSGEARLDAAAPGDAVSGAAVSGDVVFSEAGPAAWGANLAGGADPRPAMQPLPGAQPAARTALEATITELESALGSGGGYPEPGAATDDSVMDSVMPGGKQDDQGTAYDHQRMQAEAAPASPEDDPTLIDEDELARIIARLVREELRGQLGERITLQVRKLVRTELAKALDERKLLG